MPSKSPKQRRFMAAAANNPDFAKRAGIPQSVAREYHEADKGMYEGGLAPMNRVEEGKGGLSHLGRLPQNFFYGGPARRRINQMLDEQERQRKEQDPDYEPWMYYGQGPVTWKDIPGGSTIKKMIHLARMKKLGWVPSETGEDLDAKSLTWYPPQQTPFYSGDDGASGGTGYIPPASAGDTGGFTEGGIDPTAGLRGRGGRRGRIPPGRGYTPPEPRDVPGGVTPPGRPPGGGLVPPEQPPIDYTPPDPRAGRDTPFSEQLRAHRERVAQLLSPGMAEGGDVRGYQEGGPACSAPTRADNPYPYGSARWRITEKRCGRDPDADAPPPEPETPPVAEAEEEDTSLLGRLFGRSERELEELEERAKGGYMSPASYIPASREVGYGVGGYIPASREVGYMAGGLAEAMQLRPPMGGVPPRVEMQAGGMARSPMRPLPPMVRKPMPMRPPPAKMPPGMRMQVPPDMPAGPVGGPRVPPNLRGFLQRRMMENRPRRGIPGPAGAGGAPNRVGQSDQQGGLARALQRGTGRAPMSRRQGFYR